MKEFRTFLREMPVVVIDGGMGTSLYDRGTFINQSFDGVNLTNPTVVYEIHREFIDAGADIIETNSFGANRMKLTPYGLEDKVYEINSKATEIALKASNDEVYVAGDIGPLGHNIRPLGNITEEEAFNYFKEQAKGLIDGGVHLIILETFTYLNELGIAVKAIKSLTDLPVFALVTVNEDGATLIGTEPNTYIPIMESWQIDVVGVNCSVGPHAMLTAVEKIMKVATLPVIAEPNAGIPRNFEGRNIYLCSPEYIATYAQRYIELGVKIVGGCCGTKGIHIKAISNAARTVHPRKTESTFQTVSATTHAAAEIPVEQKSKLSKSIVEGKFVVSVELTPPKGWDITCILEKAKILFAHGIDCINIPDGPRASARMSSQIMANLIQREADIEVLLHYTCRDRNLLGMQSDLLGNYAAGIRNLLIITGDPPKVGDYPDATAVFDVDSIGLTRIVYNLNKGIDIGMNAIGKPTGYFIGVGVNPNAIDLKREIDRFFKKAEAGAEFAITQPVFDVQSLISFLERIQSAHIPILAGLWPLVSYRNAEFMKYEVPGVYVPDEIVIRMSRFTSKEDQIREGMEIACETLTAIKEYVNGVQISAPFGNINYTFQVLDGIVK
jgi:homocysteine S-methyltransferase